MKILGLILGLMLTFPASATLITVDSTEYDVQWVSGSWNDLVDDYDLEDQIWFSNVMDFTLSEAFSDALYAEGELDVRFAFWDDVGYPDIHYSIDGVGNSFSSYSNVGNYAYVSVSQIPEPSSIALLGFILAGLGFRNKPNKN